MTEGIACALPLAALALRDCTRLKRRRDLHFTVTAECIDGGPDFAPVLVIGADRFKISEWTMHGSPTFAHDARRLADAFLSGELAALGFADVYEGFGDNPS